MRVAEWIIERLAQEGIDTCFGVYGGAMAELADATHGRMRVVWTHHEQAAIFAAEGWAKVTGKPGLVIVTSGPGVGNIVTGLQNCQYDSCPLIALTGQVSTQFQRPTEQLRQTGFQECPTVAMTAPITKFAQMIPSADMAEYILKQAIWTATDGRKGPAVVDCPTDVQKAEMPPLRHEGQFERRAPYPDPTDAASAFLADLAASSRPGILVGGGAYSARHAIEAFAAAHNIPVFRTWNALDVVTDDSPVYAGTVGTYGGPGRNFGIQNTDLLLCLGTRLSGRITGGMPETFARHAKLYVVDVDPAMLEPKWQPRRADVNVLAEAGAFVERVAWARDMGVVFPWQYSDTRPWLTQCRDWLARYDPVRPEMLAGEFHHYGFMRRLSEALPDNAIVVSDTGGNQIMMGHCFRSKRGQRIFSSNGNSPMGFAMCGAIGAWFAEPSRPVIAIIGDGGMQMNIQELQTLRRYGCNVKVFVINNGILGNTASYQRVNGKREIACAAPDYDAPEFTWIAQAYGVSDMLIKNWLVCQPDALRSLIADRGPFVVNVEDPDRCDYEPRMSRWDCPIEEMYPPLPDDEFREIMGPRALEGWEKRRG